MQLLPGDVRENFLMAIDTLRSNKLRSFLTVFGVVIGVWTVMAIASVISGIDTAVTKEVEAFGTRSIFVTRESGGLRRPTAEEAVRKRLTEADLEAVAKLEAVDYAVPQLDVSSFKGGPDGIYQVRTTVSTPGKTSDAVSIQGTTADYEQVGTEIVVQGRFFTAYESGMNQSVCVIGASVANSFFPNKGAVGSIIKIGGREFRVIGRLQHREQLFGGNSDQSNKIYIPYGTARKIQADAEDLTILAVSKPGRMDEAKNQIVDLLRLRRKVPSDAPDNFGISTSQSIIDQFRSITAGVSIAMVVLSSVGLMVGGIGVMNIMLVSVTERTREIGTRKAIGARRRDILWQFLIEAMTLTGTGGVAGLALGWATTFLIRYLLPSYVPAWAPALGFFASIGIGLIFGLFPAWKAANLTPIEALRYE